MRRNGIVLGIFAGALAIASAGAARGEVVEWAVSDGGNGHLYQVVVPSEWITWEDARAEAEALGPGWHLATITSEAENEFVFGLIDDPAYWAEVGVLGGPWIGAFRTSNSSDDWQWVTGEAWSYTNWAVNQPANDGYVLHYLSMTLDPAPTWNDSDGGWPSFVAEKCPPCPEPCQGDVDLDGDTDVFDFSRLAANFGAGPGATRAMGDVTGDGFVDAFDFCWISVDYGCGAD
jgi:hypothetical protein